MSKKTVRANAPEAAVTLREDDLDQVRGAMEEVSFNFSRVDVDYLGSSQDRRVTPGVVKTKSDS